MKKEHHCKEQENENTQSEIEHTEDDTTELNSDICNQLETLKQENESLKDELLRAMAESENIKKRCAAEMDKNNKYAIASFAKDLLGVADNLDRALNAAQNSSTIDTKAFLQGVELTKQELSHVFEKFGITKMDIIGQPFDPNFHQVVQQVSDPSKAAGTVIEELQTGYMINGRLLREAMVIVSKE